MDGESKRSHNRLGVILQNQPSERESLPLDYLREITNNFCDEHLLGKGGFGIVYKGVVQNGDMIAVKKLTLTTPEIQDRQFENEVRHLMGLKHPNIVQLVGYCSEAENTLVQYNGKLVCAEKPQRLICLEYMSKGSLREHLSDEKSGLDWDTRYRIIQGICYGLHYLHEEWNVNTPIIHMDLKPPNILLDDNMVPKIADFGLSRLFGEEQTRTCTASRDGTLGYMAPEYINRGIITKKLDIFSLGVIIIEIMTGRKDYPYETETSSQKFTELVLKNWRNRLENASRYAFLETGCQQIGRCIEIGLACVKVDWEERPTTCQIIKLLHGLEGAEYNNERPVFGSSLRCCCSALAPIGADRRPIAASGELRGDPAVRAWGGMQQPYGATSGGGGGGGGGGPATGLEESMRRLGLGGGEEEEEEEEAAAAAAVKLPERPGEADCTYYLRTGACGYGERCRYNHPRDRAAAIQGNGVGRTTSTVEYPERPDKPSCVYYLKTGICHFGSNCKYDHPRDVGFVGPVVLNSSGYPLRVGEKECSYYIKTGYCMFGATCKFNHPELGAVPSTPWALADWVCQMLKKN